MAGRLGIVTGAQLVPFQCSTVALSPTAQASEEDSTLTAVRTNLSSVTAPELTRGPWDGAAAAPSVTIKAAATAALARIRIGLPSSAHQGQKPHSYDAQPPPVDDRFRPLPDFSRRP